MLIVEDLSAGYTTKPVLQHVSFSARSGEFIALLGQNGSGKSTLLRSVGSVLRPMQGRVLFQGQDLRRLKTRERARLVACVPQKAHLPGDLTVLQCVLLGRYARLGLFGRYSPYDHELAEKVLAWTGTLSYKNRVLGELSGGQLQKVLLAMALAQEPQLLLLDEVTQGIDLAGVLPILELLQGLCAQGMLVLCALHDANLAAVFATRLLALKNGEKILDAPTTQGFTPDNLSKIYDLPMSTWTLADTACIVAFPESFAHHAAHPDKAAQCPRC